MRNALKAQVIMIVMKMTEITYHEKCHNSTSNHDCPDNDGILLIVCLRIQYSLYQSNGNFTQVVIVPGDIVYQVFLQQIFKSDFQQMLIVQGSKDEILQYKQPSFLF